jgi:hypothetical protein
MGLKVANLTKREEMASEMAGTPLSLLGVSG